MAARKWRQRVLLAWGAAALASAGLELYQRVFDPIDFLAPKPPGSARGPEWTGLVHQRSERPGLLYEMAPNVEAVISGTSIHTNALGFRGPEPEPAAADAPDALRILAVGDSLTFGLLVGERELWTTRLQASLAEALASKPVVVLNAGVCGYSTRDEAAMLAARWNELAPDVLVLAYCLNDPDIEPWQPLQRHFMQVRWWQHSHVLRRVARKLQVLRRKRHGDGDYYRYLHADEGPCWASVPEALGRIAALCEERDVPRLLVVFPVLESGPWSEYPYLDLHAKVRALAEGQGFEVVDLLEAFSIRSADELRAQDGFHFNALGHALAAGGILSGLQPLLREALEVQESHSGR